MRRTSTEMKRPPSGLLLQPFDGAARRTKQSATTSEDGCGKLRTSTSVGALANAALTTQPAALMTARQCVSTENVGRLFVVPPPPPQPNGRKAKRRFGLFSFRFARDAAKRHPPASAGDGTSSGSQCPLARCTDMCNNTTDPCGGAYAAVALAEDEINSNSMAHAMTRSRHVDDNYRVDKPTNLTARQKPAMAAAEERREPRRLNLYGLRKHLSSRISRSSTACGSELSAPPIVERRGHVSRSDSAAAPRARHRPRSAHFEQIYASTPVSVVSAPRATARQGAGSVPLPESRLSQYRRLEKLGEGSYATVFKCRSAADGCVVALKEIKLQPEEGLPFTAIREASLLKGLKHSNIVLLHDIIYEKECLTFVFEYMQSDLSKYLEDLPNGINLHNVKLFLYQLLRGLSFCHERKILHRDLKPQNLLINQIGELKLADFGLARAKSVPCHTYSHEVVTLWYRPPDVLLGSTSYSSSLDMWGVGCIFAEMITGCPLFPGTKDVDDQLNRIFATIGTPSRDNPLSRWPAFSRGLFPRYRPVDWCQLSDKFGLTPHCEPLLSALVQLNPERRVSALGAIAHPYFSDLPPAVHSLPHISSIFVHGDVKLAAEPVRIWNGFDSDESQSRSQRN